MDDDRLEVLADAALIWADATKPDGSAEDRTLRKMLLPGRQMLLPGRQSIFPLALAVAKEWRRWHHMEGDMPHEELIEAMHTLAEAVEHPVFDEDYNLLPIPEDP